MTSDLATGTSPAMSDHGVSRARLIILRALYAFIAVGLGLVVWPAYLAQIPAPAHFHGVVMTMLAAFSILCAIGIRYPLAMLPILLWELLWKALWLATIAFPRWMAETMDPPTVQTAIDCVAIVLVVVAMPWGYFVRHYVTRPAERAFRAAAATG